MIETGLWGTGAQPWYDALRGFTGLRSRRPSGSFCGFMGPSLLQGLVWALLSHKGSNVLKLGVGSPYRPVD